MTENKKNIYDILIIAVLITLVIIRLFLRKNDCSWINAINFGGIIIAYASLYFEIFSACKKLEKINYYTGISVFILIVLVVIEVLVAFNIIKISSLGNDVITLITLLISLPAKFYKKLIAHMLN